MKRFLLILLVATITAYAAEPVPVLQPTVKQLAGHFQGGYLGCIINLELKESGDYKATWNGCLGEYGAADGTWAVSGMAITLNPINESGAMKGHLHLLNIIKEKTDFAFVPDLNDKTCFSSGSDGDSALHRRKQIPASAAAPKPHRRR